MRAPEAGRHGQATVYNTDPAAQAKAFEDQGFEWLHVVDLNGAFAGESGQWRSRRSHPEGDQEPGAARRRHPHAWRISRTGSQRACPASFLARSPCAIRRWSTRPASAFPARSPLASTPRAARSPSKAGRKPRRLASMNWRRNSKALVSQRSSTPISTATACLPASTGNRRLQLADAVSIPVIASGGLASIADIVRMTMPDAQKLEGAISGRALYDGRIDPAEALAILRGRQPLGSGRAA